MQLTQPFMLFQFKGILFFTKIKQDCFAFFADAVNSLKESSVKSAALEEMVQNLSQDKVQHVTEVEKLKKELQKSAQAVSEMHEKLEDLTTKFDQTETQKQVIER